jgi:hypothetical protein
MVIENQEDPSQGMRTPVREYRAHPYRTPNRVRVSLPRGKNIIGHEVICKVIFLVSYDVFLIA